MQSFPDAAKDTEMEAEAAKRKERLEALKKSAQGKGNNGYVCFCSCWLCSSAGGTYNEDRGSSRNVDHSVKFRNYVPSDTALQAEFEQPSLVLKDLLQNAAHAEEEDEEPSVKPVPVSTVETQARAFEEEALQEPVLQDPNEDLDLSDLAPKKPNWDLKRDLEKKLEELTPKTQAAMAELIRTLLFHSRMRQVLI